MTVNLSTDYRKFVAVYMVTVMPVAIVRAIQFSLVGADKING